MRAFGHGFQRRTQASPIYIRSLTARGARGRTHSSTSTLGSRRADDLCAFLAVDLELDAVHAHGAVGQVVDLATDLDARHPQFLGVVALSDQVVQERLHVERAAEVVADVAVRTVAGAELVVTPFAVGPGIALMAKA